LRVDESFAFMISILLGLATAAAVSKALFGRCMGKLVLGIEKGWKGKTHK
jgi:hypothetical protein